jgi:hypothetical protein
MGQGTVATELGEDQMPLRLPARSIRQ